MNATTRSGTTPTRRTRTTKREPAATGPEPSTRSPSTPPCHPGTPPRNWPTSSRRPAPRSTPPPRCHHRARSTPPRSPASRGDLGHRSPAGSPMGNLQEITASLPPLRSAPRAHRKPPRPRPDALRVASYAIAAMAAVTVSMVSVFSGVVTYEPLLLVTTAHSSGDSSSWWPILVYGPWLAGSFSILRAALHQRRALHSWFVVLLSSPPSRSCCAWPRRPAPSPTRRPRPSRASPPWPASSSWSARSLSPAHPDAR